MSFLLELHCDMQGKDCQTAVHGHTLTHMADSDRLSTMEALRALEKKARDGGWKRVKGDGWACPDCQYEEHERNYLQSLRS